MTGSQVQDGPGEVGRCGHKALRIGPEWGAQVFCRLPSGHAGWHRGDDGSEWTNDTAPDEVVRDIPEEIDMDDEEIDAAAQRARDDEARRILADPAGHLADRIAEVAQVVRGEGALAARPGQMARLEKAADQLIALAEEVRSGSPAKDEDDDGPDYRDPWTLTPDDMEIRRQFEDLPHEGGWS
jgi:hypothetical protein